MFTDRFIELGGAIVRCSLILFLIIFVIYFSMDHIASAWEALGDFLFSTPDDWTIKERRRKAKEKKEKRRVKKWTRTVKKLNRMQARREIKAAGKHSQKKAINAVAHTLASHEEILSSMYGEDAVPTPSEVVWVYKHTE